MWDYLSNEHDVEKRKVYFSIYPRWMAKTRASTIYKVLVSFFFYWCSGVFDYETKPCKVFATVHYFKVLNINKNIYMDFLQFHALYNLFSLTRATLLWIQWSVFEVSMKSMSPLFWFIPLVIWTVFVLFFLKKMTSILYISEVSAQTNN